MGAYNGFKDYIQCVREEFRRRDEPLYIGQLDNDVGYNRRIESVLEVQSANGWNLYGPNVRLALVALVFSGEAIPVPLLQFAWIGTAEREADSFSIACEPDQFASWGQFVSQVISQLGAWANELVDLSVPVVEDELFDQGDLFPLIRKSLVKADRDRLAALAVSSRFCSEHAKFLVAQVGNNFQFTVKQADQYGNQKKLLIVYDRDAEGVIDDTFIRSVRDKTLIGGYAGVQVMSNKLKASKRALLRASCGFPEIMIFGCGEVVSNTFLSRSGVNPKLRLELGEK